MADKIAIARCNMPQCGMELYSDMSNSGNNPFCKHNMVPVVKKLLHPELEESVAFGQMDLTMEESRTYHGKFTTDNDELQETYNQCKQALRDEFDKLEEELKARHDDLLEDLDEEFDKRSQKIDHFLKSLENHQSSNKKCKETCEQRILENRYENIKDRVKQNVQDCEKSFQNKSVIHNVPIKLEFMFNAHKRLMSEIAGFGRLSGKDEKIAGLKSLPWTVYEIPSDIKVKSNKNIDYSKYIPVIRRGSLKYSKEDNSIILQYTPKEYESDNDNEMKEYESIKNENIAMHIECAVTSINKQNINNKLDSKDINWNQVNSILDRHIPMQKPNRNGKYIYDLSNFDLPSNNNVYCQIRFECLKDVSLINNGILEGQDNILECGKWVQVKPTKYKIGQSDNNEFNELNELNEFDQLKGNNFENTNEFTEEDIKVNDNEGSELVDEPARVKVKAFVKGKEDTRPTIKSWILKQKDNEYNLQTLFKFAKKALKLEQPASFKITNNLDNNEITNDNDVKNHIVFGKMPDGKYNAIITADQM